MNSGGTLQLLGYDSQIFNGSTAPLTVKSGGLFDLNGVNNTLYSLSLSGTGISGSGALINSAVSSVSTLTCPITLAAPTTIGGSTSLGNITLPGAISGLGMSLTYAGTGTLTLSAANTYTGGTIINAGTLDGGVAGSIPGNVTVTGSGGRPRRDVFGCHPHPARLTFRPRGEPHFLGHSSDHRHPDYRLDCDAGRDLWRKR